MKLMIPISTPINLLYFVNWLETLLESKPTINEYRKFKNLTVFEFP
jgi:hypothetical protein